MNAELIIDRGGKIRMIYSELVDPHQLGRPTIRARFACRADQ